MQGLLRYFYSFLKLKQMEQARLSVFFYVVQQCLYLVISDVVSLYALFD